MISWIAFTHTIWLFMIVSHSKTAKIQITDKLHFVFLIAYMDRLASQLLIVLKISLEDSSINNAIILLYCSVHLVAKQIVFYIVNRLCFS